MAIEELSIAVVGVRYDNLDGSSRSSEIARCEEGEEIELRSEPENPADHNAIAVFSARGIQIGYVPADRARLIHRLISEGTKLRAIFQDYARWGAVIRVRFDGQTPTIPYPHEADRSDADTDFWPDEFPPEGS